MCIIAIKPEGISIPTERLKTCWDNNPDGVGFMYSEAGKLNIIKGLMTFDSFIKSYNDISPLNKRIVIHFRYGTHGKICPDLTHPFIINKSLALVHNGILSIDIDDPFELENKVDSKNINAYIDSLEKDSEPCLDDIDIFSKRSDMVFNEIDNTSDSLEFCRMLSKLPKKFLSNKAIFFLLSKYVSRENSVIIFMDDAGAINIVGNNSHIVEDGVWYSNYDYSRSEIKKTQNLVDEDEEDDSVEINKCPYCPTGNFSSWMLNNGHPAISACSNNECPTNSIKSCNNSQEMKGTEYEFHKDEEK